MIAERFSVEDLILLAALPHRCAESLWLSVNAQGVMGYASKARRSLAEVLNKRIGKAEPFRTSGGIAAPDHS